MPQLLQQAKSLRPSVQDPSAENLTDYLRSDVWISFARFLGKHSTVSVFKFFSRRRFPCFGQSRRVTPRAHMLTSQQENKIKIEKRWGNGRALIMPTFKHELLRVVKKENIARLSSRCAINQKWFHFECTLLAMGPTTSSVSPPCNVDFPGVMPFKSRFRRFLRFPTERL